MLHFLHHCRLLIVLLFSDRQRKRRWTQLRSSPTNKIRQSSWPASCQTDFPRYLLLAASSIAHLTFDNSHVLQMLQCIWNILQIRRTMFLQKNSSYTICSHSLIVLHRGWEITIAEVRRTWLYWRTGTPSQMVEELTSGYPSGHHIVPVFGDIPLWLPCRAVDFAPFFCRGLGLALYTWHYWHYG